MDVLSWCAPHKYRRNYLKVSGSCGCSNHEIVEFLILTEMKKASSRAKALAWLSRLVCNLLAQAQVLVASFSEGQRKGVQKCRMPNRHGRKLIWLNGNFWLNSNVWQGVVWMVEAGANCPGRLLKTSAQVWRSGIRKAIIWLELRLVINVKCSKKGFCRSIGSKKIKEIWTCCWMDWVI